MCFLENTKRRRENFGKNNHKEKGRKHYTRNEKVAMKQV